MKKKKKIKKSSEEEDIHLFHSLNKKKIAQLKSAYKKGLLKLSSQEIAEAILADKDIRKGLTK